MKKGGNLRGSLGIDESNHGRTPEFLVAVFSKIPEDIQKKKNLSKKLFRNKLIEDILERDREFMCMLIPKDCMGTFQKTYRSIKTIAFSTFIKFFSEKNGPLEKIIIDGDLFMDTKEELKERYQPDLIGHILSTGKADTKYEIVRRADALANTLFRDFRDRQELNSNLLIPSEWLDNKKYMKLYKGHSEIWTFDNVPYK